MSTTEIDKTAAATSEGITTPEQFCTVHEPAPLRIKSDPSQVDSDRNNTGH